MSDISITSCSSYAYVLSLLTIGVLLGSSTAYAQKDYEEWRKQQEQQYEEYLNEQDQAFLKFLQKQWKDVDVEARMGSPIDNKPREIPTVSGGLEQSGGSVPSDGEERSSDASPSQSVSDAGEPEESPEETTPDVDAEPPSEEEEGEERQATESVAESAPSTQSPSRPQRQENASMSQASMSFFGVQTTIPYSDALTPAVEGAPGKESIGDFWAALASQSYSPTLKALQQRREELGLSDWGYYVYVRNLSDHLYQQNGREAGSNDPTLWTWFMMIKSGYSVRVGYRDDDIFLMLPVDGQIFNRPQLRVDGQRYYLMVGEGGSGSLRTYEGQHESADRVLTLDETDVPSLGETTESRSTSFSYDDQRYTIDYEYNPAVLEYLRAYPNVELRVLFRSGVSSVAEASLVNALQPHVADRSPRNALNILLRFTQFATKYQRDRDNFGEERFLFPEESLAASASDCEDRAVLFAYLARTLMDRELVGLQWPGHVATAVKVGDGLSPTSDDRTLTVNGDTYILADPTYIGSSIGMEMPFVEGKEPEVISF